MPGKSSDSCTRVATNALKFGAIDIGSNAVRLLITNVFETPQGPLFRKSELIRLPVRLGEDVFSMGHIGPEKAQKLVDTMHAFKLLLGVHWLSSTDLLSAK